MPIFSDELLNIITCWVEENYHVKPTIIRNFLIAEVVKEIWVGIEVFHSTVSVISIDNNGCHITDLNINDPEFFANLKHELETASNEYH